MTIWDRLGIERTNDIREIKKAYAKAVKHCHREEHPKEWQLLHEAYEKALDYAKGQGETIVLPDIERTEKKTTPPHFEKKEPKKIYTPIFAEIVENADHKSLPPKRERSREEFQEEKKILQRLQSFSSFKVKDELHSWHMYLFSNESEKRYLDFYFWEQILRALNDNSYHKKTYQQIRKDIQEIRATLTTAPPEISRLTMEIGTWCDHYVERKNTNFKIIRNTACVLLVFIVAILYGSFGDKEDDNEIVTLDFQELAQNYENQQVPHTFSGDEEVLCQFVMTNGQLPQGQTRLTKDGNFFYIYQDERYATVKEAMNARTSELQSDRFEELADLFYEEYGIRLTVIALPQEVYDGLLIDKIPLYALDGKCPINEICVSEGYWENQTSYIHPVTDGVWAVEQIPDYYYSTSANDFFNSIEKESLLKKNGNTWNITLSELFVYDVVLIFDEDKYVVEGLEGNYETTSEYGLYQISVKSDRNIQLTVQSFDEP